METFDLNSNSLINSKFEYAVNENCLVVKKVKRIKSEYGV